MMSKMSEQPAIPPAQYSGQITPRELAKAELFGILPPQAEKMLRDAVMRDPDTSLGNSLERSMALLMAESRIRELWPECFAI